MASLSEPVCVSLFVYNDLMSELIPELLAAFLPEDSKAMLLINPNVPILTNPNLIAPRIIPLSPFQEIPLLVLN